MAKAYDSISPELLFQWLKEDVMNPIAEGEVSPEEIAAVDMLRQLYEHRDVLVGESANFKAARGVMQGGPSSCLLFNYYLDKVLDTVPRFKKMKQDNCLKLLAYADDLIFMCESVEEAENVINDLEALLVFGMRLNYEKSMVFGNHPQVNNTNPDSLKTIGPI